MSSKLSDNTLEQTQAYWRERTGREVTRDDAREMVDNISGFFQVLSEWDQCAADINDTASSSGGRDRRETETASRPSTHRGQ